MNSSTSAATANKANENLNGATNNNRRRAHNLYVKRFPREIDEHCLRALFLRHGAVVSACVLRGPGRASGVRKFRGGGGGGGGRGGENNDDDNDNDASASNAPDSSAPSSKRCGFVEMATAEAASSAIEELNGKFLSLQPVDFDDGGEKGGERRESAKEERQEQSFSSLSTSSILISGSLVLVVSKKPLVFSSSSEASSKSSSTKVPLHGLHVARALSKESRQEIAARERSAAAAAAAEREKVEAATALHLERGGRGGGGGGRGGSGSGGGSGGTNGNGGGRGEGRGRGTKQRKPFWIPSSSSPSSSSFRGRQAGKGVDAERW